jgi:choline dehydrogenase-like flavoprotein
VGGSTFGHAVAKAGCSVLFCERGASSLGGDAIRGTYPEMIAGRQRRSQNDLRTALRSAGRCSDAIVDVSAERPRSFVPFIGSGTGGSSALYGMAFERLFPADFAPRRNHPSAQASNLPENWPISYAELARYYIMAERLYGVRGTQDPLRSDFEFGYVASPPDFSVAARELVGSLQRKGLHPYHLPLACEYVQGCPGCQGYLCAANCKHDSTATCLAPALAEYDACLLTACEVLRLESTERCVTAVLAQWQGRECRLRGKTIVLAAGALFTPMLLQRSISAEKPDGLANESGLVGRNLMRHHVDLYAVFPSARPVRSDNAKELALNDFYATEEYKLGSIQSFGAMLPARMLVESMEHGLRDEHIAALGAVFRLAKPLLGIVLDRLFSRSVVLATIMEDLPYLDNRVQVSRNPGEVGTRNIMYRMSQYDAGRIATFRQRMKTILRPYRYLLIKQAENNQRLAHACGTCRFGLDPRESVLDRNNRAHGLDNLYVVDASFFPSSGGTNPALTIAANALRVAEHLVHSA